MRAVVQRCTAAAVTVDGVTIAQIERGLVILVGVRVGDTAADAAYLAQKSAQLRIFADAERRMNLDVLEAGGSVLSVSQFTLYGDMRKGRRPNFTQAAPADVALPLYRAFNQHLTSFGLTVVTGEFGAMMQVALVNDGPVTLLLDSDSSPELQ